MLLYMFKFEKMMIFVGFKLNILASNIRNNDKLMQVRIYTCFYKWYDVLNLYD